MVKLPPRKDRTAAAIFERHERDAEDWRRPHLGASLIGDDNCLRNLWYSFRWAFARRFEGRLLRLFERGHREEAWVLEELRKLGWTVQDVDPETGEQFRVAFYGGHFGGSTDGQLLGVLEAPKTWHLFECKSSNKRRFDDLLKQGVAKAQKGHHAQMQVYMHGRGLKRALYVCVCKDDDRIYTERVHYDPMLARGLAEKAGTVIRSDVPLSKVSEDPTWFECKLCDHRDVCHLGRVERLERNCRTCASSTPREDGTWHCGRFDKTLSVDAQKDGCGDHLFIPQLLPWEWTGYDEKQHRTIYTDENRNQVIDHGLELTPCPIHKD